VKDYLEKEKCPGTVIFYGCPGEEGGSGKAFMARDGIFDELDCAITWHPWDLNFTSYETSLANYQVAYRFKGISSHAASSPHLGRSALDAVELMNVGVQFLREHVIDSARIHYAITNTGGFSPNVVQPQAEVLYLIRAPKNQQVQEIFERVNKIAQGAALMTETVMEYDFIKSCSNMIPNYRLCQLLQEKMEEIAPPTYTDEELSYAKAIQASFESPSNPYEEKLPHYSKKDADFLKSQFGKPIFDFVTPLAQQIGPMGGSTDVGDVSWVCPTAQIMTTTKAALTPAHSWQQTAQGKCSIAHKGMLYAGKVMAAAAIELIESPSIVEEAKQEHRDTLGGAVYHCAIPKDVRPRSIAPSK
ncbi:MAG: amidohydrolase, partial [Oscillospiraceae bacterium]